MWFVMAGTLALAASSGRALGNGDVQREIQGRVISVNPGSGTLVVARELRGKTTQLRLRMGPGTTVFACGGAAPTLDGVKPGGTVSVFYEVLGSEGVANLVVVEPGR
ncbi:MAG: hypothetical protein C5B48_03765 [Candidatus Rokuibacteriota bacterium]|nr:MAG: hypothetical protein C5B48_03765 [Candidatus Rokubacteria bacterium]